MGNRPNSEEPRRSRSKRANGEGSIYQRKDGRWVGAAYVLTEMNTYKRQAVYGHSWDEVHDKILGMKNNSRQGIPSETTTKLSAFLHSWLEEVCRPQLRPRTFETYTRCVARHIVPTLGNKSLRNLTPMDVRRLLNERHKSGLSPQTVRYIHAVLRTALAQATRDGLVQRNVATLVKSPPMDTHEVQPLTLEEARTLLRIAEGTRLYAAWVAALALGLRRGELLGLSWSGLDLEEGTVSVRQSVQRVDGHLVLGGVKTARSRRKLPLPQFVISALRDHKTRQLQERLKAGVDWVDHDLIFTTEIGTPIDPRNLNRSFTKLLIAARVRVTELPGELKKNGERGPSRWSTTLRLHDLRHSCASFLLSLGVPMRVVMEILGHSQIGITSNLYTHVLPDVLKGSLDGMDGLFGA